MKIPIRAVVSCGFLPFLVVGLSGCDFAISEVYTDYMEYDSGEEAVEASDVVVVVRVVGSREEIMYPTIIDSDDPLLNPQAGLSPDEIDMEDLGIAVTVTTVEVLESLRGDYPVGSEIDVTQMGGKKDGVRYVDVGSVLLTKAEGDEFMLLLADYGDGDTFLVSPTLGIQELSADGDTLEPVVAKNGDWEGRSLDMDLAEVETLVEEQDH